MRYGRSTSSSMQVEEVPIVQLLERASPCKIDTLPVTPGLILRCSQPSKPYGKTRNSCHQLRSTFRRRDFKECNYDLLWKNDSMYRFRRIRSSSTLPYPLDLKLETSIAAAPRHPDVPQRQTRISWPFSFVLQRLLTVRVDRVASLSSSSPALGFSTPSLRPSTSRFSSLTSFAS